MRITRKGQITIPIGVRKRVGLLPGTEVTFSVKDDRVIIKKAGSLRRGQRLIAALRGKATKRLTTDQIMALTRGS